MLTANEAFLVREAVREKIETLREAVRHESAKHPTMQDIRTLKHFQAELERYEVAYQKNAQRSGVLGGGCCIETKRAYLVRQRSKLLNKKYTSK